MIFRKEGTDSVDSAAKLAGPFEVCVLTLGLSLKARYVFLLYEEARFFIALSMLKCLAPYLKSFESYMIQSSPLKTMIFFVTYIPDTMLGHMIIWELYFFYTDVIYLKGHIAKTQISHTIDITLRGSETIL